MNGAKGPSRPLMAAIVVGWAALASYVETVYAVHGTPLQVVLHDWVPGASWLIAGLIAWRRRSDVMIGRVMVAVGFAWFVGGLGGNRWLAGFGQLFGDLDLALIAWLVFAYPIGHISRRYERAYVAVVVAWIAVIHVGDALVFSAPSYYHCDCAPNALAVFDSPHLYDRLHSIEDPLGAAITAVAFVLLIVRFVGMPPGARRGLSGLWVASLFLAVFLTVDNFIKAPA